MRNAMSLGEAFDKNGILHFGLLEKNTLACYNSKGGEYGDKNYSDKTYTDTELLDFIYSVKVTF